MTARFRYFRGTNDKDVQLAAGDTLLVYYDISLTKGSLTLLVEGPKGKSSEK
ncbi:MAG: hypothetical protein ACOX5Q_10055 [Bacillota bacterium]